MLQDIPKLGNPDPRVSKNAALNIVQHVSQNKSDLGYLVKRLVNGLESVKVSTRSGCYSTLGVLLKLQMVGPAELLELMQKALVTNKKSTKKERRLIYVARILCTGAVFRNSSVVNLNRDTESFRAAVADVVDLASKKAGYFQLATPFLAHLLQDNTMTQEVFDGVVWPLISPLFVGAKGKKDKSKKKNKKQAAADDEMEVDEEGDEEEEEDEEEENSNAVTLTCGVMLALACKNGEYKNEFECLKDVSRIAKALLVSRLQFEESFLASLFKHLKKSSPEEATMFWTTLVDNIKSTQFDLLCLCVDKSVSEGIPLPCIVSRKLVTHLLSVFKQSDSEFHAKARQAVSMLLQSWSGRGQKEGDENQEGNVMSKKERKSVLKCLFGGDPPNLLHEYKYIHSSVRQFLMKLGAKDLDALRVVLEANLVDDTGKLGPRMAVIYLQVLAVIAQAKLVSSSTRFEIAKRLLGLATGGEKLQIEIRAVKEENEKDGQEDDEDEEVRSPADEERGVHEHIKKCSLEGLKVVLSNTFDHEFMQLVADHLNETGKELSDSKETLKLLKEVRKAQKKLADGHPFLRYLLWAYALRVLLEEGEVLGGTAAQVVSQLIEIANNNTGGEEEVCGELVKFVLESLLKDPHPPFHVEGMFNKLNIEGKVTHEVVQAFAEAIEFEVPEDDEDEEGDSDDSSGDDENDDDEVKNDDESKENEDAEESEDEDQESQSPPKKKARKEGKALNGSTASDIRPNSAAAEESDSEESIALDEATEEDLQRMDSALAKVFAVKKQVKEEENSSTRALMRTLRLVNMYVSRNVKGMQVSGLLILLMPVVHSLQASLRLKRNQELTTRIIGVLDSLNRVKKFTGSEELIEGTLATIAEELYEMAGEKRNKLIRELLEHSCVMVTRCFLQLRSGKKAKKEGKRFVQIYVKAVDKANVRMRKRKINSKEKGKKRKGWKEFNTSKFVRFALESLGNWTEGRAAIEERIRGGGDES